MSELLSELCGIPKPGEASARPETVRAHDELQALVSSLAGVALEDGNQGGVTFAGVPPIKLDGTRREGFIVNPTRKAAG